MMRQMCLSRSLQMTLTAIVSFMVVLTTCSTKECILQEAEKLRDRAAFLTKRDIKQLQTECMEDSCHQSNDESKKTVKTDGASVHEENQPKILTEGCGSVICSQTSKCVEKVCVEVTVNAFKLKGQLWQRASTDLTPNSTDPPAHVTTQDPDLQENPAASRTDAREDLTPSKTVPPAPVTQDSEPHATPSPATMTKLFSIIWRDDLQRVKRILTLEHVNINARGGRWRRTPVMEAARWGRRDMVDFLLGRGADVSLVDRDSNNVLHLACMGGDLETVKLILSLDLLDINARNNIGWTAAYYARRHGHQRIFHLLVSRGAN